MATTYRLFRRTFAAEQHPPGSPERQRLNQHSETSEYGHSHKYGLEGDFSHGGGFCFTYRTKREAEDALARYKAQDEAAGNV